MNPNEKFYYYYYYLVYNVGFQFDILYGLLFTNLIYIFNVVAQYAILLCSPFPSHDSWAIVLPFSYESMKIPFL
jgi:hypothetical protein